MQALVTRSVQKVLSCNVILILLCHVICRMCRVLDNFTIASAVYALFFRRYHLRRHAMEIVYFVNLIFILGVNVLFFFSGICLNSLVIVSFWRSVQLRKKLCYFTIMILSCCDLLAVLTSHPVTALRAVLWLNEKSGVYPRRQLVFFHKQYITFTGFSLLALLVISVDRYLATHYPILHRRSVTKGKLLTLFTFLAIIISR